MKKSILPIIFVLIAIFPAFSQDYIPFPDSSARWSVEFSDSDYDFDNTFDYYHTWRDGFYYELVGDTIVDEMNYTKVVRKPTWNIYTTYQLDPNGIPYFAGSTMSNCTDCTVSLVGGIREDTLTRKVYYINFNEQNEFWYENLNLDIGEEILLYDFNANIGDTIYHRKIGDDVIENPCELTHVVYDVDSVMLNDGIYRRRISLYGEGNCAAYIFENNAWVEGVGDMNSGLLGPLYFDWWEGGEAYELDCFKKNDEYLITKEYGFCDSIVVSIDEKPDILLDEINVFPNPAGSVVNISHTSGNIKNLKVFNILGKEIYAAKSREKTVPLDVTRWESGIYFVVVNGRYSARFVVR